jgi:hypothetical protein
MMRFLAIIIAALIHLYLVADVNGKSSNKRPDPKKSDSNIAVEAAKGIKLFDAGRFQEALTIFSRYIEVLVVNYSYSKLFTTRSDDRLMHTACFDTETWYLNRDSGLARETRMFELCFNITGDGILT